MTEWKRSGKCEVLKNLVKFGNSVSNSTEEGALRTYTLLDTRIYNTARDTQFFKCWKIFDQSFWLTKEYNQPEKKPACISFTVSRKASPCFSWVSQIFIVCLTFIFSLLFFALQSFRVLIQVFMAIFGEFLPLPPPPHKNSSISRLVKISFQLLKKKVKE